MEVYYMRMYMKMFHQWTKLEIDKKNNPCRRKHRNKCRVRADTTLQHFWHTYGLKRLCHKLTQPGGNIQNITAFQFQEFVSQHHS